MCVVRRALLNAFCGNGKGKAHRPYELCVKVSVATPFKRSVGGQFIAHHTLATVIPGIEALVGNVLERIIADAGYRGQQCPGLHRGAKSVASPSRSSAAPPSRPVIGQLKHDHRPGSQLSRPLDWRRHQRRARRRRLQLPPPPRLSQHLAAQNPDRSQRCRSAQTSLKNPVLHRRLRSAGLMQLLIYKH